MQKQLEFIKHSFDLQILVLDIMKPVHNKGHVSMGCLKKKNLHTSIAVLRKMKSREEPGVSSDSQPAMKIYRIYISRFSVAKLRVRGGVMDELRRYEKL